MVKELHDIFPYLTQKKIWKLLLIIKSRYNKYWKVWISRLEASRIWTSERQMQNFINYLREIGAFSNIKKVLCKKWYYCNCYSLSEWFVEWLEQVRNFVKQEYINPVKFVLNRFPVVRKYGKIKFKVNWERYIIHTRWDYKNVIYDVWNNCIINPLDLC